MLHPGRLFALLAGPMLAGAGAYFLLARPPWPYAILIAALALAWVLGVCAPLALVAWVARLHRHGVFTHGRRRTTEEARRMPHAR